MNEREVNDVQDQLEWLRRNAAFPRKAKVLSASPFQVAIAGSDTPYVNPSRLSSYAPGTGDDVEVLIWGKDMLVLGRIN